MPGFANRMILDRIHKDYIDPSYLSLASLEDSSELQDLGSLTIMDNSVISGNHGPSCKANRCKCGVGPTAAWARPDGSNNVAYFDGMDTKMLPKSADKPKKAANKLHGQPNWTNETTGSLDYTGYDADAHDLTLGSNADPRLMYQHDARAYYPYTSTSGYTNATAFVEVNDRVDTQSAWQHVDPTRQPLDSAMYYGTGPMTSYSPTDGPRPSEGATVLFQPEEPQWHQSPTALSHETYPTVPEFGLQHSNTTLDNGMQDTFSVQELHYTSYHTNSRLLKEDEESDDTADAPELIPSSQTSPSSSENSQDNGSFHDFVSIQDDSSFYKQPLTGEDGKFVCPFAEEQDCGHPPTKHRCAYEKYLDSHYKPHRCRIPGCEELRFSSSACLVRHEREAHGSHGHGVRPFLCLYTDCERSKEGNGFPRSWNRNDHMKRVHDYHQSSQVQAEAASDEKDGKETRKRPKRASSNNDCSRSKRQKSCNKQQVQSNDKLKKLFDNWVILHSDIHNTWHAMRGPLDLENVQKLHDQTAELLSSAQIILAGVDRSEEEQDN